MIRSTASMLRSRARRLSERLEVRRRVRAPVESSWREAHQNEIEFWRNWLATGGDRWPEDYARKTDPDLPVGDPLLLECLDALPPGPVSILDVGAGPLTGVAKVYPGREIRITAVDPLAEAYDELLDEAGVTPRARTIPGTGETLLDQFETGAFDIAHASNALDHALDPAQTVRNMWQLVAPGGFLALRHYRNEGETQQYSGFHRWNLDKHREDLVMWRPGGDELNLTAMLSSESTRTHCWVDGEGFVLCTVQKTGSIGPRDATGPRQ